MHAKFKMIFKMEKKIVVYKKKYVYNFNLAIKKSNIFRATSNWLKVAIIIGEQVLKDIQTA